MPASFRHFFMPEVNDIQHPVILFDGFCNLCSGLVQFVIKRDKRSVFQFASLQSSIGQTILKNYRLPLSDFNTFVLLQNEKIYTKSTAALMVAKHLAAPWPVLYLFIIIPAFIRNSLYNIVARNRYKWFGKKENCFLPSPDWKVRFLD
jgi:predicted DCC family thiol-disulfide oxidoreductase YuxK